MANASILCHYQAILFIPLGNVTDKTKQALSRHSVKDEQAKMPAFRVLLGTTVTKCFHLGEFTGQMLPGRMLQSHCSQLCGTWEDSQICLEKKRLSVILSFSDDTESS